MERAHIDSSLVNLEDRRHWTAAWKHSLVLKCLFHTFHVHKGIQHSKCSGSYFWVIKPVTWAKVFNGDTPGLKASVRWVLLPSVAPSLLSLWAPLHLPSHRPVPTPFCHQHLSTSNFFPWRQPVWLLLIHQLSAYMSTLQGGCLWLTDRKQAYLSIWFQQLTAIHNYSIYFLLFFSSCGAYLPLQNRNLTNTAS